MTHFRCPSAATPSRRGGALVIALLTMVLLTGLGGAILTVNHASRIEQRTRADSTSALFAAEAGVSHALANLTVGVVNDLGAPGAPLAFGGGEYGVTVVDNADGTFRLTSLARHGTARCGLEAVVERVEGGVFGNAVFAGNSSGDPAYTLEFGGLAGQADQISGDVYSAGHVLRSGDATIAGTMRAGGTVVGGSGEEGVAQPLPDIPGMTYETNHDVDVAAAFASSVRVAAAAGGSADQVPASDPAHIFRRNPSDRVSDTSLTAKDDYFLEDPYEPLHTDPSEDGSDPAIVSLSGGSGPGPDGNDLVYFIDGNLWLHSRPTFSFRIEQPGGTSPVRVTFVVKGNIYFSDNLFYGDPAADGVAFIAMRDAGEPDSGNIYFGDPVFGTLRTMNAFMYAENDFYDTNLDAAGSATVTLNGNMSAGNQVLIQRDFGTAHSKLTVNYDDRISTGAIDLPGLPGQSGAGGALRVVSWREVAVP